MGKKRSKSTWEVIKGFKEVVRCTECGTKIPFKRTTAFSVFVRVYCPLCKEEKSVKLKKMILNGNRKNN